jgi:hypothetical protein
VYKDAGTVVASLLHVFTKGGNLLMNIGPDSTGVWAPEAVATLRNLSTWMSINSEAVAPTVAPLFPYAWTGATPGGVPFQFYFAGSTTASTAYVFLVPDPGAAVTPASPVIISHFKPATLAAPPTSVSVLRSGGAAPVAYTFNSTGLVFAAGDVMAPAPVILGTYFHNYSVSSADAVRARAARGDEWPQVWWKAGGAAGRRGGAPRATPPTNAPPGARATGAASVSRAARLAARLAAGVGAPAAGAVTVDRAPCGDRGCSVYTSAGYTFVRAEGVCYRTALLPGGAAAVPVQLYFNGATDNLGASAPPADGQTWQDVDVECWAYAAPGAGLIPLELWHAPALSDYWTLADPASRAEAAAAGYTLVGTVGYVEAAAGGGLTPAQQADAAAAYAYVLKVQW